MVDHKASHFSGELFTVGLTLVFFVLLKEERFVLPHHCHREVVILARHRVVEV